MSLSVELPRFRTLTGALLTAVLLAACTGSEPVSGFDAGGMPTGAAGTQQGSGAAGTGSSTGAAGAGSTTGAAGQMTTGAAGVGPTGTGAAGAGAGTAGHGGTTGAAGAGTGAAGAGSTGTAGTSGGAAGTNGAAGMSGAAGTGAQQWVYSGIGGIENVLVQNCGGCHYAAAGVTIQGGFSFNTYESVTAVITSGNKACPNLDASKRRVVAGHPENSLLYIKISMDKPPAGCGGHMPYTGQRLTDNVLGWIHDWILQGAKP